jgi:hypothetical protein
MASIGKISLAQLLRSTFGTITQTRQNPGPTVTGATAIVAVPLNPNRVSLVICNLGTNYVYVSPQEDVSATKGIALPPGGSSISFRWDVDMMMLAGRMFAISPAGASQLFVMEEELIDNVGEGK